MSKLMIDATSKAEVVRDRFGPMSELRARNLVRQAMTKNVVLEAILDVVASILEKDDEGRTYRPIQVGDGVTQFVGSDRYPFTVTRVISEKKIEVQADRCVHKGDGVYEFLRDMSAPLTLITLRKDGMWAYAKGKAGFCPFVVGKRDYYNDPSF